MNLTDARCLPVDSPLAAHLPPPALACSSRVSPLRGRTGETYGGMNLQSLGGEVNERLEEGKRGGGVEAVRLRSDADPGVVAVGPASVRRLQILRRPSVLSFKQRPQLQYSNS